MAISEWIYSVTKLFLSFGRIYMDLRKKISITRRLNRPENLGFSGGLVWRWKRR